MNTAPQNGSRPAAAPVLVAGGAGFLGSHLCERLLAEGYAVLCLDNFSTGHRENVDHLLGHSDFTLLEHDVCTPLDIPVSAICNLACPASPVHYQRDPVQTLRSNVIGTLNLLELACRQRARLLQASTSEVYGDPAVHPQPESYWGHVNPTGPRACYDEGKRCAETLCFDYQRRYGVEVKVARIFNTYGPRMHPDDGRAVSNFVVQALRHEALTLHGDGSQTRSFCYVDDLIEGLLRLLQARPGLHGPLNLGNPEEYTMRQVAELVLHLCGLHSPLQLTPRPTDDPGRRCPDIRRAQAELDWTPQVPLAEGLLRTIGYFKARLNQ